MSDTSPFILYAGDSSLTAAKTLQVDVGFGLVPDGGDIVLTAENMLGELQSLVGTGIMCVTGTDSLALRSITSSTLNINNPAGIAGNISIEQNPSSAVQLINVLLNGVSIGAPISSLNLSSGTGSGIAIERVGTTANCTFTSSFDNPMTTVGDLILGGASGAPGRLPIGTNGQVLKSNGSTAGWSSDTGFTNPMTTAGDMIYGGASGVPTRIAAGTAGQVLKISGGNPTWSADTGFTNPMTTIGDIIVAGALGVPARLGIGSAGNALIVSGGTALWGAVAPVNSKYIVQTADGVLTDEQALGALATGILKNTTITGVLSIADPTSDYFGIGTTQGVFVNTLTVGGSAQSLYAFYASAGTSSASFVMDPSVQAVPVPNVGILSMAGSKVLHFTNNVASYAVAFGVGATGSIPLGAGGVGGSYADLAIGANGRVLTSDGTTASWEVPAVPNAFKGTATLAAGTVVVNNANVTADASFAVTYDVINSSGTLSIPTVAIVPGVSFTINSSSGADASTVTWIMVI